MHRLTLSRFLARTAAAVFVLASILSAQRPPQGMERAVSVQFGWTADAHHAGFIVARDKGFFAEQGLQVELRPGGPGAADAIDAVLSGEADIGQAGGIEQLIRAWALDRRVIPFAAIHRDTPDALISLAGNPIRSAAELPGKRIAVAFGDAAEILLRAFLHEAGIDPNQVTLLPFEFDLKPLIEGEVDAVTGFRTDQPATLTALGIEPVVLAYSTLGVESYGYTFFTSERLSFPSDDLTSRFAAAARKGWSYVFENREEAVDILIEAVEGPLDRDVELAKLDLLAPLMLDRNGRLATWRLDRRRVESVAAHLVQQGLIDDVPAIPTGPGARRRDQDCRPAGPGEPSPARKHGRRAACGDTGLF